MTLGFGSGRDLRVVRLSHPTRLSAQRGVYFSLSRCPSAMLTRSHVRTLCKINKYTESLQTDNGPCKCCLSWALVGLSIWGSGLPPAPRCCGQFYPEQGQELRCESSTLIPPFTLLVALSGLYPPV